MYFCDKREGGIGNKNKNNNTFKRNSVIPNK